MPAKSYTRKNISLEEALEMMGADNEKELNKYGVFKNTYGYNINAIYKAIERKDKGIDLYSDEDLAIIPSIESAIISRMERFSKEIDFMKKTGNVVYVDDVVAAISKISKQIVDVLEYVPNKIKGRLPNIDARTLNIVKEEIARAQNIAADMEYNPDDNTTMLKAKVFDEGPVSCLPTGRNRQAEEED